MNLQPERFHARSEKLEMFSDVLTALTDMVSDLLRVHLVLFLERLVRDRPINRTFILTIVVLVQSDQSQLATLQLTREDLGFNLRVLRFSLAVHGIVVCRSESTP